MLIIGWKSIRFTPGALVRLLILHITNIRYRACIASRLSPAAHHHRHIDSFEFRRDRRRSLRFARPDLLYLYFATSRLYYGPPPSNIFANFAIDFLTFSDARRHFISLPYGFKRDCALLNRRSSFISRVLLGHSIWWVTLFYYAICLFRFVLFIFFSPYFVRAGLRHATYCQSFSLANIISRATYFRRHHIFISCKWFLPHLFPNIGTRYSIRALFISCFIASRRESSRHWLPLIAISASLYFNSALLSFGSFSTRAIYCFSCFIFHSWVTSLKFSCSSLLRSSPSPNTASFSRYASFRRHFIILRLFTHMPLLMGNAYYHSSVGLTH